MAESKGTSKKSTKKSTTTKKETNDTQPTERKRESSWANKGEQIPNFVNNRITDIEPKIALYTQAGHRLSQKEALFIDKYLEEANATQAAIYAGFKESNARSQGSKLLSYPYIQAEIQYRLAQKHDDSIATADEIRRYFTRVMRGEEKDQFGLDASLAERTKAAQELAKREIDMVARAEGKESESTVRVILDW